MRGGCAPWRRETRARRRCVYGGVGRVAMRATGGRRAVVVEVVGAGGLSQAASARALGQRRARMRRAISGATEHGGASEARTEASTGRRDSDSVRDSSGGRACVGAGVVRSREELAQAGRNETAGAAGRSSSSSARASERAVDGARAAGCGLWAAGCAHGPHARRRRRLRGGRVQNAWDRDRLHGSGQARASTLDGGGWRMPAGAVWRWRPWTLPLSGCRVQTSRLMYLVCLQHAVREPCLHRAYTVPTCALLHRLLCVPDAGAARRSPAQGSRAGASETRALRRPNALYLLYPVAAEPASRWQAGGVPSAVRASEAQWWWSPLAQAGGDALNQGARRAIRHGVLRCAVLCCAAAGRAHYSRRRRLGRMQQRPPVQTPGARRARAVPSSCPPACVAAHTLRRGGCGHVGAVCRWSARSPHSCSSRARASSRRRTAALAVSHVQVQE